MKPKMLQLLRHLRNDSREKLTSISKKTNIPISSLFDMLKLMQGTIIKKSTVILDYHKLGFDIRTHLLLKAKKNKVDIIKKKLNYHENVNNIYKINSGWDFIVETAHKNIREFDVFLEEFSELLEEKQVHYIIDDIKREKFDINLLSNNQQSS